jgi:hypothetical protein
MPEPTCLQTRDVHVVSAPYKLPMPRHRLHATYRVLSSAQSTNARLSGRSRDLNASTLPCL